MKKSFIVSIMLITSFVLFMSCDNASNSGGGGATVVSTWHSTIPNFYSQYKQFILKSDNTFEYLAYKEGEVDDAFSVYKGTYTQDDTSITFTFTTDSWGDEPKPLDKSVEEKATFLGDKTGFSIGNTSGSLSWLAEGNYIKK
ncbi:MAG: hypothetical protein ACRC5H_00950 [Treponemataceae bacterium]